MSDGWGSRHAEREAQCSPYYDNLRHCLHDLAQPLSTVTGLMDLMLLELDEQDKMFQEVQLISQQLEKVMEIIGEIRRMAQEAAEDERKPLEPPRPRCLEAGLFRTILFQRSDRIQRMPRLFSTARKPIRLNPPCHRMLPESL